MTRAAAVLAVAVLTGAAVAPAAPIAVSGVGAGGVRLPALAIDPAGDGR